MRQAWQWSDEILISCLIVLTCLHSFISVLIHADVHVIYMCTLYTVPCIRNHTLRLIVFKYLLIKCLINIEFMNLMNIVPVKMKGLLKMAVMDYFD